MTGRPRKKRAVDEVDWRISSEMAIALTRIIEVRFGTVERFLRSPAMRGVNATTVRYWLGANEEDEQPRRVSVRLRPKFDQMAGALGYTSGLQLMKELRTMVAALAEEEDAEVGEESHHLLTALLDMPEWAGPALNLWIDLPVHDYLDRGYWRPFAADCVQRVRVRHDLLCDRFLRRLLTEESNRLEGLVQMGEWYVGGSDGLLRLHLLGTALCVGCRTGADAPIDSDVLMCIQDFVTRFPEARWWTLRSMHKHCLLHGCFVPAGYLRTMLELVRGAERSKWMLWESITLGQMVCGTELKLERAQHSLGEARVVDLENLKELRDIVLTMIKAQREKVAPIRRASWDLVSAAFEHSERSVFCCAESDALMDLPIWPLGSPKPPAIQISLAENPREVADRLYQGWRIFPLFNESPAYTQAAVLWLVILGRLAADNRESSLEADALFHHATSKSDRLLEAHELTYFARP